MMTTARASHTATLLNSGLVLVVGGAAGDLFNPATGFWATTGPLASSRAAHTATLLPTGKVLVAGGVGLNTSELFDPDGGTWAPTPTTMAIVRAGHTAVLLPSGKVLISGARREVRRTPPSSSIPPPGSGPPPRR